MGICGDDKQKYLNRLSRIEGQIRGLKKMVADDRECMDVLKQIASASGAMRSLGMVILHAHLKGCVAGTLKSKDAEDGEELIHQVMEVFNKFSK